MDQFDHVSNRVTVVTLSGLVVGASIATYKALPLPRTALSVAASFALITASCLIPERIIHQSSFYFFEKFNSEAFRKSNEETNAVSFLEDKERRRLLGSHIGGGIVGGTVSGSLFQKRLSFNGMALFTPIMISVAFIELYLQDYRKQRLKEIEHSSQERRNSQVAK